MDITETLYLSGRMTNQPGFNFPQFDSAKWALRLQGYNVISPADHDREVVAQRFREGSIAYRRPSDVPGYEHGDVVEYQKHAGAVHDLLAWDFLQIIQKADGIALLPGWEYSSGARAERFVAEAVGKHVYLVDRHNGGDWTLASDIVQRRLDDHVSLFAASAVDPTVRPFPKRTGVVREADNEAHYRDILEHITDEPQSIHVVDRPVPPLGTRILPPRGGEVRVVDPSTGGAKGAKAQAMHLIPGDALLAISEHLNKGAEKYAERNWELGYAWSLSFAAMQRHLWAWWQGENDDPEFAWSHLRAVGFHALVLLAFELRGAGTDDRPSANLTDRWEASDER